MLLNRFFVIFLLLIGTNMQVLRAQPDALPLVFVPNEGQWAEPFLYKGISANADIYLEQGGITYVVGDEKNTGRMHHAKEGVPEPVTLYFHAYRMKWLNAHKTANTTTSKKQNYYHNYYLGNEPSRWKGNVGVYGNVDYQELYNGIDLHLSSDKGHLKYDFIVKPGSNPADIRLQYEGLDKIELNRGNLLLYTSVGIITEVAPYAYQYINGALREVPCKYKIQGNELSFQFPKGYDPSINLVIDPTIIFATLTGSKADNWGFTATYDHAGNFYAGGIVSGNGYPTTNGAFQQTFGGGTGTDMPCDISIAKFNAAGNILLYSTYIGGTENEYPHSLVVDTNNNLIMAGKSMSSRYPTTAGAYDQTHNGGYDIVVTKFNAGGTALLSSTFVGGTGDDGINVQDVFQGDRNTLRYNYGDNSRSEVILDKRGDIYIAASSQSSDFPFTSTAVKNNLSGSQDGVFFKLDPALSALMYSTYLGGTKDDAAYVLALDTGERYVYVGGGTQSADFFPAPANTWQSTYQGGSADGYICRFLNSGAYPIQQVTFVGTNEYDQCYGLQVDLENNVYTMGQTLGAFPVTAGVYNNANSRHFLIKMNDQLTNRVYSTVFGNGPSTFPNLSPVAFLVDTCQNVYISGWGGLPNGQTTTKDLPVTKDAFQSTTDGSDFYFIVFSKNAQNLLFGSYFGSPGKTEHVDGGTSRFDPNGVVYQAICASCATNPPPSSLFPATPGAYSATKGLATTNCNLGAVKIAFNLGSVRASANVSPKAKGCVPFTVSFSNASANATSYSWDFGDNSALSTAATPTHTFTQPGTYKVRLVASNPNACKVYDTVFLEVIVSNDTMRADFDYTLLDTCNRPHVVIDNNSSPMPGHTLADVTFQWFWGDNSSDRGPAPPPHYYSKPGTYTIMMIMTDTAACNSPDTVIKQVEINPLFLKADFRYKDTLCAGDSVSFSNITVNGSSYEWHFGKDQGSSTETNPAYVYKDPGSYTVLLVARNPKSCNTVDSIRYTVTVLPKPVANFTYNPILPETNVPTNFFNQSQNANRYQWTFGDGTGSIEENPVHQYNRSGDYKICLTAYNDWGCADVICRNITADVLPLADVPTGFSPNADGSNDILYVRGFSIQSMDFKIINRWGEVVFESQNQSVGWDGTFKGKPQEMEVYGYTLFATFYDGTTMKKQGNVTLLR